MLTSIIRIQKGKKKKKSEKLTVKLFLEKNLVKKSAIKFEKKIYESAINIIMIHMYMGVYVHF